MKFDNPNFKTQPIRLVLFMTIRLSEMALITKFRLVHNLQVVVVLFCCCCTKPSIFTQSTNPRIRTASLQISGNITAPSRLSPDETHHPDHERTCNHLSLNLCFVEEEGSKRRVPQGLRRAQISLGQERRERKLIGIRSLSQNREFRYRDFGMLDQNCLKLQEQMRSDLGSRILL